MIYGESLYNTDMEYKEQPLQTGTSLCLKIGTCAGNKSLLELVFAFTGCPHSVADQVQQPIPQYFASQVLPAFEKALGENKNIR